MDAKTYCKPCFKKLFFSKGNYSEGFGQLKPQAQHELKKAGGESPVVSPQVPHKQPSLIPPSGSPKQAKAAEERVVVEESVAQATRDPEPEDEPPRQPEVEIEEPIVEEFASVRVQEDLTVQESEPIVEEDEIAEREALVESEQETAREQPEEVSVADG